MENKSPQSSSHNINDHQQEVGLLSRLSPRQFHLLLGEITSLLLLSKVHRKFQIRDIADIILPYINSGQFKLYRDKKADSSNPPGSNPNGDNANGGNPTGFITWAKFSSQVEQEYMNGKIVLSEAEINSGDIIYITDFIAPYKNTQIIKNDLMNNLFAYHQFKAIRFTEPGLKRTKIWKFKGNKFGK